MSPNTWLAISTIITAVVAALASSGLVGYFQNKGKTNAEQKQIEEDVIAKIRATGDKKSEALMKRGELQEYKFDMLLEDHLSLIDKVKETCAAPDKPLLADLRASALRLKYIDRIPGQEPPPPFPDV